MAPPEARLSGRVRRKSAGERVGKPPRSDDACDGGAGAGGDARLRARAPGCVGSERGIRGFRCTPVSEHAGECAASERAAERVSRLDWKLPRAAHARSRSPRSPPMSPPDAGSDSCPVAAQRAARACSEPVRVGETGGLDSWLLPVSSCFGHHPRSKGKPKNRRKNAVLRGQGGAGPPGVKQARRGSPTASAPLCTSRRTVGYCDTAALPMQWAQMGRTRLIKAKSGSR